MKRSVLIIIICFSVVNAFALTEFEKLLENAKTYYSEGDYEKAISELERARNFVSQSKEEDLVEAYKYLGFSYVAFGEKEKAKESFKNAIKLSPELELDSALVSPKIVAVFEEAKTELIASGWKPEDGDTTEINPVPSPMPVPKETPKPPVLDHPITKGGAFTRSAFVPGLGQIYKGQKGKGYVFMGAAALTGIIYLKNRSDYNSAKSEYESATFDADHEELFKEYESKQKETNTMAMIFTAVYAVNIIDATMLGWENINLRAEAVEDKTMITLPKKF